MVRKWMSPVSIEFFNISILQSNYDAAPTAFSITIKKKKKITLPCIYSFICLIFCQLAKRHIVDYYYF